MVVVVETYLFTIPLVKTSVSPAAEYPLIRFNKAPVRIPIKNPFANAEPLFAFKHPDPALIFKSIF